MVRLNAWTVIAKCLALTKEIVEGVQGVRIVINAANGESLKIGVAVPDREEGEEGPVAITK
jgi:hypothetical protein